MPRGGPSPLTRPHKRVPIDVVPALDLRLRIPRHRPFRKVNDVSAGRASELHQPPNLGAVGPNVWRDKTLCDCEDYGALARLNHASRPPFASASARSKYLLVQRIELLCQPSPATGSCCCPTPEHD